MAYNQQPGITGTIAGGGQYDNLDTVDSLQYNNTASSSAAEAILAKIAAEEAQLAAEAAQTAAESAETGSEAAKTASQLAQSLSETARTASQLAQSLAETARIASESARDLSQGYATSASTSASTATTQAGTATTQAGIATTQAGISTTQAGISTTQASNSLASANAAALSAAEALVSEGNADTSETNSAASAAAALTSEGNASTSETNAATSETNAGTSATNAAASEANALTYSNTAVSSAATALSAQTAAESARDSALAAYDNFDDRYLGAKASDPIVDNDGNALIAGALYFSTALETIKVYTGSTWVDAYADGTTFLAKVNNLSELTNVVAARTNLGLGTSATTDSTTYATAAQGTTADSALQPGAIGVSVQGYNVNTVIDSAYVRTDNNYTTSEKTAVSNIEATAIASAISMAIALG